MHYSMVLLLLFGGSLLFLLFCLSPLALPRKEGVPLISKRKLLALSVIISLLATGLYSVVGTPHLPMMIAKRETEMAKLEETIEAKKQKLLQNPTNIALMVQYATLLQQAGRLQEAEQVMKNAVIASGGDVEIILLYVRSQIVADQGKLDEESQKGLDLLKKLAPENPHVRFFTGLEAEQQGDTTKADEWWNALASDLPAEHPLQQAIIAERKAREAQE